MLKTLPPPSNNLQKLFASNSRYAWDLLQHQIAVDTHEHLLGNQIADLLSLYMKGVQVLNFHQDPRESYFRAKVSCLMMKPNVIKSMKLKSDKMRNEKSDAAKPYQQMIQQSPQNYESLRAKKVQMELHLTYQTQSAKNKESFNKLLTSYNNQLQQLNGRIEKVSRQNREMVEERIRNKKIRSRSAASVSQKSTKPTPTKLETALGTIPEEVELPKLVRRFSITRRRSLQPYTTNKLQRSLSPLSPLRRRNTIMEVRYRVTLN